MLGLGDFGIFSAYVLCILAVVACVVYGVINWNKGDDPDEKELTKEIEWNKEEQAIVEETDI